MKRKITAAAAALALALLGLLGTAGSASAATGGSRGPGHSNGAWTCVRVPSVLHMPGNRWCYQARVKGPHGSRGWQIPTTRPTPAPSPTGSPIIGRFVPMGG